MSELLLVQHHDRFIERFEYAKAFRRDSHIHRSRIVGISRACDEPCGRKAIDEPRDIRYTNNELLSKRRTSAPLRTMTPQDAQQVVSRWAQAMPAKQ